MNEPLFSVVIPTYNRANLVTRAIRSVLGQSFRDFELTIVDDGSTDDTRDRVLAMDDSRLHYHFQENRGRSTARNAGTEHASGVYVAFLDSDDEACENWLERLAVEVFANPGVDLVCCGARWHDQHGDVTRTSVPQKLGPIYCHLQMQIRSGTYALRRDRYHGLGGYRDGLEMCEHTELAFRLAQEAVRNRWTLVCIDDPLVQIYTCGQTLLRNADNMPETIALLLDLHADKFSRDPKKLAQYYNIAGVAAFRAGDLGKARRYFWQAVKTRPVVPFSYLRLVASALPSIGKRVWRRKPPTDIIN